MNQKKIPIIFRVPLALIVDGAIAFGPVIALMYLLKHVAGLIIGVVWLVIFYFHILWRLDCFWNLKMLQNKSDMPINPDNLREFKTLKGRMVWVFLGRDIEN